MYDQDDDGFTFTKSKKTKAAKAPAVRNSTAERASPAKAPPPPSVAQTPAPAGKTIDNATQKKPRRRLPDSPERTVRRSKRLSNENVPSENHASPHKVAHAKSHANHERLPSPLNARPVTIEKKRRRGVDGVEEEKIMRIQLPFADTPVIKRNKEMRKTSAENGHRRSSSGMRGKRASSLIDEGRGNGEYPMISSFSTTSAHPNLASLLAEAPESPALSQSASCSEPSTPSSGLLTPPSSEDLEALLRDIKSTDQNHKTLADEMIPNTALPHSEVPSAEFFKHISAELTEPRRMRCLLGWCGTRALPPKPEAPKDSSPSANLEFQAFQAGTSEGDAISRSSY